MNSNHSKQQVCEILESSSISCKKNLNMNQLIKYRLTSVYLLSLATLAIILVASIQTSDGAALNPIGKYRSNRDRGCYYMLQHFKNGEQIKTDEPCLNCTCENSMLMCYLRVCPYVKPVGDRCIIERIQGECCPKITCSDVAPSSENIEQEIEPETVGPTTPSTTTSTSTTTTTASASNSFEVAFTNASEVHSGAGGCMLGSNYYHEGAQMPSDPSKPCEVCYCIRNSSACVMQDCALEVGGCTPIYQAGGCCPTRYNCSSSNAFTTPRPQLKLPAATSNRRRFWENNFASPNKISTLVYDNFTSISSTTPKPIAFPEFGRSTTVLPPPGCRAPNSTRTFNDGERVPSKNKCEHCYCMRSEIVCAVQECRPPCDGCVPIIDADDQCCPKRYECAAPTQRVPTDNVIDNQDMLSTSQPAIDTSAKAVEFSSAVEPSTPSPTSSASNEFITSTVPNPSIQAVSIEPPKPEISIMTTRQTKSPLRPISPKLSLNEDDSTNEMIPDQDATKSAKQETPPLADQAANVDGFNLHGEREHESDSMKPASRFVAPEGSQPSTTNHFQDLNDAIPPALTSIAPTLQEQFNNQASTAQRTPTSDTALVNEPQNPAQGGKSRPAVVPSTIPGEGSCRYNGRMYHNGQEVKSKDNCMEICMCINSVVYCDEVDCPKGPENPEKCQRIMTEGECCPKYICNEEVSTSLSKVNDESSTAPEMKEVASVDLEFPKPTGSTNSPPSDKTLNALDNSSINSVPPEQNQFSAATPANVDSIISSSSSETSELEQSTPATTGSSFSTGPVATADTSTASAPERSTAELATIIPSQGSSSSGFSPNISVSVEAISTTVSPSILNNDAATQEPSFSSTSAPTSADSTTPQEPKVSVSNAEETATSVPASTSSEAPASVSESGSTEIPSTVKTSEQTAPTTEVNLETVTSSIAPVMKPDIGTTQTLVSESPSTVRTVEQSTPSSGTNLETLASSSAPEVKPDIGTTQTLASEPSSSVKTFEQTTPSSVTDLDSVSLSTVSEPKSDVEGAQTFASDVSTTAKSADQSIPSFITNSEIVVSSIAPDVKLNAETTPTIASESASILKNVEQTTPNPVIITELTTPSAIPELKLDIETTQTPASELPSTLKIVEQPSPTSVVPELKLDIGTSQTPASDLPSTLKIVEQPSPTSVVPELKLDIGTTQTPASELPSTLKTVEQPSPTPVVPEVKLNAETTQSSASELPSTLKIVEQTTPIPQPNPEFTASSAIPEPKLDIETTQTLASSVAPPEISTTTTTPSTTTSSQAEPRSSETSQTFASDISNTAKSTDQSVPSFITNPETLASPVVPELKLNAETTQSSASDLPSTLKIVEQPSPTSVVPELKLDIVTTQTPASELPSTLKIVEQTTPIPQSNPEFTASSAIPEPKLDIETTQTLASSAAPLEIPTTTTTPSTTTSSQAEPRSSETSTGLPPVEISSTAVSSSDGTIAPELRVSAAENQDDAKQGSTLPPLETSSESSTISTEATSVSDTPMASSIPFENDSSSTSTQVPSTSTSSETSTPNLIDNSVEPVFNQDLPLKNEESSSRTPAPESISLNSSTDSSLVTTASTESSQPASPDTPTTLRSDSELPTTLVSLISPQPDSMSTESTITPESTRSSEAASSESTTSTSQTTQGAVLGGSIAEVVSDNSIPMDLTVSKINGDEQKAATTTVQPVDSSSAENDNKNQFEVSPSVDTTTTSQTNKPSVSIEKSNLSTDISIDLNPASTPVPIQVESSTTQDLAKTDTTVQSMPVEVNAISDTPPASITPMISETTTKSDLFVSSTDGLTQPNDVSKIEIDSATSTAASSIPRESESINSQTSLSASESSSSESTSSSPLPTTTFEPRVESSSTEKIENPSSTDSVQSSPGFTPVVTTAAPPSAIELTTPSSKLVAKTEEVTSGSSMERQFDATSTISPTIIANVSTVSPADTFLAGLMTTKSSSFKPVDVTTVIPSIRGAAASITIPWSDISSNSSSSNTEATVQPTGIVLNASNNTASETKSYMHEPTQSSISESDYEEITEDSGCEYEGKTYNSAQQIPKSNPCDFCFCFRGDIICLQQTCPPPVPHCFETIMDGFCCPRYECPVHTVRSSPNSTNLSLTPYDTHSRLHAHSHDSEKPQPVKGSSVRGCFVDNKLYGVGQVIESASSPCLECRCDKSGMMKCNPKECTPEDPLLQQINREVLQSTLSRSQVR